MPMSPRLLRPRATAALVAVDADARTYINAVRTADGGQYMEPAVQLAIDAFVIGCKADGIWSAIKACCILMGARTLSGALTPLVGSSPTNNGPFVAGDYNRETGLIGNGSTKYLDTNRAADADPRNNFHGSVYYSAALSTGFALIGAGGTSPGATGLLVVSPSLSVRIRSAIADVTQTASIGFVGMQRDGSSSANFRVGGATTSFTETSQTPTSDNLFTHARNNGSGTAAIHSNARIAFYSVGEALTLAALDSRVSTLYTAIGAAI